LETIIAKHHKIDFGGIPEPQGGQLRGAKGFAGLWFSPALTAIFLPFVIKHNRYRREGLQSHQIKPVPNTHGAEDEESTRFMLRPVIRETVAVPHWHFERW
jgi:hypothetical protein